MSICKVLIHHRTRPSAKTPTINIKFGHSGCPKPKAYTRQGVLIRAIVLGNSAKQITLWPPSSHARCTTPTTRRAAGRRWHTRAGAARRHWRVVCTRTAKLRKAGFPSRLSQLPSPLSFVLPSPSSLALIRPCNVKRTRTLSSLHCESEIRPGGLVQIRK